ncbi:MAG: tetratricopeptide repeat protein, partial [Candidatus Staskawiczbacteria bacterium]|nr:tetratricopeptide repeat protein [Candidatus Staskawiczbacteria bacterium]
FFVLLNLQINWLPQKTNEIFLSQKAGLDISMQSLREKPIFGSGLGTFAYDFSKFKNPDFSKTSLWNITFNKSSSKALNSLATTGVLGFLAMLAFMAFPIFYAIKFLFIKKKTIDESLLEKSGSKVYSILLLGISIVLIEQTIAYFLYNSNIALDLVYFFTIAALIGIIPANKKEYVLKPSSFTNLIVTLVFTLVFIFGMGLLILDGQRYIAEVNYYQGLAAYQANQKIDGLKKLESAASLNPDELQNVKTAPDDQEKAKIQTLIANSINAGKIATDINSHDVNNWSSRGYVYQNLFVISGDASAKWAIDSYDSAIKLDPYNPYLFAQEGNVYLAQALSTTADQADQKNQLLSQAQTKLEKAVALNSNYSNALYSLGLVYDNLGQKDKAITAFKTVQQLNPNDKNIQQGIQKILDNLNAGLPALQTATPPPTETPPSTTNGTVENPPTSGKITPTPKTK